MKKINIKKLVGLSLLTAVVVLLQLFANNIQFGIFSITLVLAPIIIGAAIYGALAGAWLGLVFGVVVLLSGQSGVFLAFNPAGTIITLIAKGLLAGLISALVYKALVKINVWVGTIAAGIICPVVNTGVFIICCYLFFMDLINEWATAAGVPNAGTYLITVIVGINFLIELAINLVLSTVIVRVVHIQRNIH